MRVVSHNASLRLGMKETFVPSTNNRIPNHYFDFATYNELMQRTKGTKMLTDYIGRVISDNYKQVKSMNLTKITIVDDEMMLSDATLEFTIWPNHNIKAPETIKKGSIIAITYALVTEFMDHPQLETSVATTITVDPTYPDVANHVNRLNKLSLPADGQRMPLAEILTKKPHRQPNNHRCNARIKAITEDTKWFYVVCPECGKHMHPQRNNLHGFSCEDHETNKQPNFMYCLNAIITDDTSDVPVVFFNDAMTSILGIPCNDLVRTHGYKDPKKPPPPVFTAVGKTREMMVTIKPNRTLTVNSVKETQPKSPLDPTTPAAKSQGKRPMQQDTEESKKRRL